MSEFAPPPRIGRVGLDGQVQITQSDLDGLSQWLEENNKFRTASLTGTNFDGLNDVTITSVADNDLASYDSATAKWINQSASDANLATSTALDTTNSNVTNLDSTLTTHVANLSNHTDVVVTSVADNEVLAYDSTTSKWINQTASEASLASSSDLGQFGAVNTQTDDYTLVIGDKGDVVEMNKGTSNNLTIPPNSSVAFPIGTQIDIVQLGAGATTIVAGSGVTLRSAGSALGISARYGRAKLYKRATDEWVVAGDLS
tara:strand:+ start:1760 stop:2533 length:774 start_codon:yes stop_codon:yes gene_type:complete